jgi:uncharacterized protein
MPLYAIHALDGPGGAEKRTAQLAAHLAHVEANIVRYCVAGPLKDTVGETIGSLLVVEAEDEADARAFLSEDPYAAAQLWDRVHVSAFAAVAGTWVGGAAWKNSVVDTRT